MNKLSFGENIKNIREKNGLDLDFCSNQLKIHKRYLKSIEADDYKVFDNYFQAQGFVQNYLEFLDMKITEHIPRWRSDFYDQFEEDKSKIKKTTEFYKPRKKVIFNFSLSLNSILQISFVALTVIFISYIVYTYQSIITSPKLEIINPKTNDVVETDLVDVFGNTDQDAILKINNEKINIKTDGSFSTSLKLSEGINNFKFSSLNPYGKETTVFLTIIYRPKKIEIYSPPSEGNTIISTKPENEIKTEELTKPADVPTVSPTLKPQITVTKTVTNVTKKD